MRKFNKQYAREVFNLIPEADFIMTDNVYWSHSCYWGTKAFAPEMCVAEDVVQFMAIHETYLGKVECSKYNSCADHYIIWREDADL